MTPFSSLLCLNKHSGKKTLSTNIFWIPSSSFPLFVFPSFLLWWEMCPDLMVSRGATFGSSRHPHHTHTQKPWMGLAAGLRSCVDFMSVGMSLCCCIFMISFDAHTHQSPWRVGVLFILPKTMNPRFIPCSHRIENNHSKSRKCVYWIPIHTEIYSNTSAWLKSQGRTPLCQERQRKI